MCGLTKAANLYYGNHARLIYADSSTPIQKIKNWMDNCSAAFQMLKDAKQEIPSFAKEFHDFQADDFAVVDGRIEGNFEAVRKYANREAGMPAELDTETCRVFERSLYLLHLLEAAEKVNVVALPTKSEPVPEKSPAPRKTSRPSQGSSLFELAGI